MGEMPFGGKPAGIIPGGATPGGKPGGKPAGKIPAVVCMVGILPMLLLFENLAIEVIAEEALDMGGCGGWDAGGTEDANEDA